MKGILTMKKKFILFLAIIILHSTFLTGCQKNSSTNTPSVNQQQTSYIKKTLDVNLEVNANVAEPDSYLLPTYTARILEPSYNQVQKAFFPDIDIDTLSIIRKTAEEDGEYGFRVSYAQKRSFNYGGYQIYMNYDYIYYYLLQAYYPDTLYHSAKDFDAASIKDAGNLSFMTKEDAISLIRDSASAIGLSLEEKPFTCIALTEDDLATLYDYVGGNPELFYSDQDISFEGDEGCYYIVWNQKSENSESIFSENYSADTLSGAGNCRGSYVLGIVNKEGIVSFETPMNYTIAEKKSEENIIDVDVALDCVKEKYSNLILNEPVIITEIYFCYSYSLIDKDSLTYALLPTWCILSHNSADDSYSLTAVNAVTGKLF